MSGTPRRPATVEQITAVVRNRLIDPRLTPEVRSVLTVPGALRSRATHGGTAPARVAEQLAALADAAHEHASWATLAR